MSDSPDPKLHIYPKKPPSDTPEDVLSLNKAFWDERADIHAISDLYDLEGFVRDQEIRIDAFQINEMGDLKDKNVVHLQCHIGTETISLARLGASSVTGLDFSTNAIQVAKELATKCDLDVRFVQSNVCKAAETLGEQAYDVAYVSVGSIRCLPDIEAWAKTVCALLKPNGFLYMEEIHPLVATMAVNGPFVVLDYFDDSARLWEETGSYSDKPSERAKKTTKNNLEIGFDRSISKVFNTLIEAGFRIDLFNERTGHPNQVFDYLILKEDGKYYAPEGTPDIPATYTLKATKLEVQ